MKALAKLLAIAVLTVAAPALGRDASAPESPTTAEPTRSILFIGNSFTQGERSAALHYRWNWVRDLTESRIGGVPAIFKMLAHQAGQTWDVAHETQGGRALSFHLKERRELISGSWDVVVMQQYSTLSRKNPGNPATTMRDAPALGELFRSYNPDAKILLMATWSRADLIYLKEGNPWFGTPIAQMGEELEAKMEAVDAASDLVDDVVPVGGAWNRAMAEGVADPNPYDGIAFGQVSLWAYDQYHASAEGSYLEALTVFGNVTGIDPRVFGADERAGHELGIDPRIVVKLQAVAASELGFE